MTITTLIGQQAPTFSWTPWGTDVLADQVGDVVLVRCRWETSPQLTVSLRGLLTASEQQRASRYRREGDRQRFTVGRGGARWLAGALTLRPPATIELSISSSGKPELVGANGWQLNVSHAGEWVLWAFSRQAVGVDVEAVDTGFAYHDLIPACFSLAEQQALQQAGQHSEIAHRQLFYTLWTRKEAILKATGLGLTDQLTALSVLDGPQTIPSAAIGAEGKWYLSSLMLANQYVASVACRQPGNLRGFTLMDQ